jgi:DNA-directed RNA polymerase specialized sigma24 family protein
MLYLDTQEADRLPSPEPGPAWRCEYDEPVELVHRALTELRTQVSETSYQVLHQHWVQGRRFAAIAKEFGMTPKQARDRHDRTFRKLRRLLTRLGENGLLPAQERRL